MTRRTVDYVTMAFPAPSETFTSLDVSGLAARGVEVRVHALRPRREDHEELIEQRGLAAVDISHYRPASLLRGLVGAVRAPRAAASLLATLVRTCWRQPRELFRALLLTSRALEIHADIRKGRPSVVHLCWAHFPSMVGHLLLAGGDAVTLSVSFSAYDIDRRFGLTRPVARRARVLRTLAAANLPELSSWLDLPTERFAVIPDGIRLGSFVPRSEREAGRIVTVGRLVEGKGIDAVLDTFVQVRRRHPGASLHILGNGPERNTLVARAQALGLADRVVFLGHQPQSRVADELAQAQVFLFLSRSERLPNVLKEALAAECACVVSATFGVRELVPDDDHGRVVEIDDIVTAAEAVSHYLGDPQLRADTGRRGRLHVVGRFDIERSLDGYLALWYGSGATVAAPQPTDLRTGVS